MLGVLPDQKFTVGTALLAPGDRVVFFTDGVTEACDGNGDEFGEARLLRLLQEHRAALPAQLQEHILASVSEFTRGHWPDDATLLVLAVAEE